MEVIICFHPSLSVVLLMRSRCQQNGRLDNSKLPSLHKSFEKITRNCQNQLCQKSGRQSKVYNNQANTESRKRQTKNSRKALWHFQLTLPHLSGSLTDGYLYFKCGTLAPDSGGAEQTLFSSYWVCSNLSGATQRNE